MSTSGADIRRPDHAARGAAVLAVAIAALVLAPDARAQDDGARVYQLAPSGAQALTAFAVVKRGNEQPEIGSITPGSDIDTDIVVVRYVRTFSLAGRQLSPFVILPVGEVSTTANHPDKRSDISSGLGDIQIGGVVGLVGSPALHPDEYAAFKPGFATGLFAKIYFPTGEYDSAKPVNFGSNRFAFQVGLPTSYTIGATYRDPALTTIEVFPTLTFYEDNGRPFGARSSSKDPLLSLEGHLTRNLSQTVWLSAALPIEQVGETTTDGVGDENSMRGLSGGGSAAVMLGRATLVLTYEAVIARSDDGPDGWFFRSALVMPF